MSLEIDFALYKKHFESLKKPNAKIQVFGKSFSIEELKIRAKQIAEPKNPVNDKKLPQKKGFATSVIFGKSGKKRLLERIYESNIDAFLRAFPDVVHPTWFVKNLYVRHMVDHLLSFNQVDCEPVVKRQKVIDSSEDFQFSLSLPYVPPNYL